jgi:SAM-dependent methyltransferase
MLALWHETPAAWATLRAILHHARHDRIGMLNAEWGAVFDRVAQVSPTAGVALYSLGRDDLLAKATASIVQRLQDWNVLGPESRVLDLGCGSGRLLRALAPLVRSVLGVDVSAGMLAVAHQDCAMLANVHVVQTDGVDLAAIADRAFDLVIAVDVFPYLVSCGAGSPARHLAEVHRVLRPRGTALIINYAYQMDDAAETAEVERLGKRSQLHLLRVARGDFSLWDGRTFLLERED